MTLKPGRLSIRSGTRERRVFPILIAIAVTCHFASVGAESGKESSESTASPADKEKAATFVREHRGDIVFIKNKQGAGSGFIVNMRGRKVLITNAHVMAGLKGATFELLDRSTLRLGAASIAVGHDLIAFVVVDGGSGIPMATNVDTEAKIGDAVVVLGNAVGGGVVNTLQGEMVGLGPDRIEVNAPFELGNSGSPIVHLASSKVIGVATYAKLDMLLSGTEKVRRFGYRLDSPKTWQAIDWPRFYSEADTASKILTATLELDEVFSDFRRVRTRNVSRAYETPAIRNALDTYYNVTAQGNSPSENATRTLLTSLRDACKSDVAAARGRFSYDYFKRQLDENEQARGKFVEAVNRVLQP